MTVVRSLGVTCNPHTAYLTLAIDGAITQAVVERVEVAAQYEASVELLSTLEEIRRALGQLQPDRIAVLMPEQGGRKRSYLEIAPRVTLETLIRIAAVQEGIGVEMLARPTLRARLDIPKTGELSSHVSRVIAEPLGLYWSAGRDVAGLAALAALNGGGT
ncbi:MAG: hypothetical protein ACLPUT_08795 [Solirubrobacteraceae bacterium]